MKYFIALLASTATALGVLAGLAPSPDQATGQALPYGVQDAAGIFHFFSPPQVGGCTVGQAYPSCPAGGGSPVGAVGIPDSPGGRLTLTSHTPVPTTTITTASAVLYDSYVSGVVPIFNGTADVLVAIPGNEVSDNIATGGGLVNTTDVFDEWAIVTAAGAFNICHAMNGAGAGWAGDTGGSATARGTGYTALDRTTRSYTTNKNTLSSCFNGATNIGPVAVNQGTYLGSFGSIGSGATAQNFGGAASGGTAGFLAVWNMYNRVTMQGRSGDSGVTYTYSSATVRQMRASAGMQISVVTGLAEDAISAQTVINTTLSAASGAFINHGVGLDSTTSYGGGHPGCQTTSVAAVAQTANNSCPQQFAPIIGLHVFSGNEGSDGVNNQTWDTNARNAISVNVRM